MLLEVGQQDETRWCDHGDSLPWPTDDGYRGGPVRLPSPLVDGPELLVVLGAAADAVRDALADTTDWGPSGLKAGQYRSDLTADAAALAVLDDAGVGVLSEESGRRRPEATVTVVVDPLDGSTNAARGVPWYATSLCAVDADGPVAALVVNLVSGDRFDAIRGGGARRNGEPITPSGATLLSDSIVGVSGLPPVPLGSRQFRALGAAALDLCAVACGVLDGYVDCVESAHGSWDYLGALLVCREAGAPIVDAHGRDLVTLAHADRRTPVAAATSELLVQLIEARQRFDA